MKNAPSILPDIASQAPEATLGHVLISLDYGHAQRFFRGFATVSLCSHIAFYFFITYVMHAKVPLAIEAAC
jgi:hypothetical protein